MAGRGKDWRSLSTALMDLMSGYAPDQAARVFRAFLPEIQRIDDRHREPPLDRFVVPILRPMRRPGDLTSQDELMSGRSEVVEIRRYHVPTTMEERYVVDKRETVAFMHPDRIDAAIVHLPLKTAAANAVPIEAVFGGYLEINHTFYWAGGGSERDAMLVAMRLAAQSEGAIGG